MYYFTIFWPGQVLMEEDRFMVCCLDTVEECNDYGHPFNTDGWTGVRVAEMVRGNTDNKYRYLYYLTMLISLTLPTSRCPPPPSAWTLASPAVAAPTPASATSGWRPRAGASI